MATLAVTFDITESADASYFSFADTTGDSPTVSTGWGCDAVAKNTTTNPMRLRVGYDSVNYYYTFASFSEVTSVEISPSELLTVGGVALGTSTDVFIDGVYDFQFEINVGAGFVSDYDLVATKEGFASVITGIEVREFLSYRIYLDYKTKDEILEKMRLMNNLAYASSVGDTTSFSENLQILEQLQ